MIAVIMVILALSETIITFDSGKIIKDEMDKVEQTDFFMKKFISEEEADQLGKKVYVEVTEGDINEFRHAGYKGDIYEVMNFTLPISLSVNFAGWSGSVLSNSIYLKETLGLLIIDDNFLVSKIGKLEYIEKVDEFCDEGVIITDYVADSMLMNNSKFNARTYKDLLGKYYYSSTANKHVRGYINGIIKTNYKETYKQLFEIVNNNKAINFNELYKNKEFMNFTNDIYSYLGFTYSFNENFKECFNKTIGHGALWHYSLRINQIDFNNLISPQIWKGEWEGYNLKENEVIMNYERYNEIFGTNYNLNNLDTFMPHEIKLEQYRYFDTERKNILMSLDLKITCLKDKDNYTFMVSDDVYNKFNENMLINIGLYFEGNEDLDKVINIGNELGYEHTTFIVEGIHTMTKAVDVFIPIFELVAIVLCAGIVFIMISFSTKMVKDKMHDIGILKALGCKNNTIGIVFGLQLLLIAICTIILSTIGYFFFIDLANDVLIESLKVLAPSHIVLDLDFLTFKIDIVGINSLLVIILTIISFVIPMLKIYRIKPVKIIKTKE
jgi:ABC-type antimicrobial peptide transport system permease subunit